MPYADLIVYNIGELVTFPSKPFIKPTPDRAGIVKRAGVAIRDGVIVDVGSSSEIRARYRGLEEINAEGRLVTPGLVDPHTHIVFAGSREDEYELKTMGLRYEEILARGGGIYRTVEATRRASLEELARLARRRLKLALDHGTTLVEVKSGYGLVRDHEIKMLEAADLAARGLPIRIVRTVLAHVPAREFNDRASYVAHFLETLREAAGKRLAKYVDVFCDKNAFTPSETKTILAEGVKVGLRARMHADQLSYIGCSDLAREIPLDSIDHLERMPERNARLLAEKGVTAVLTPTSILAMMDEARPPVKALRDAGVAIAVATDYNPNNMTISQQLAVALSTYMLGLTPIEALAAATVNAAWSLREAGGRVAVGEPADLLIWEFENYRWIGYEWGRNAVITVIAQGHVWKNLLST